MTVHAPARGPVAPIALGIAGSETLDDFDSPINQAKGAKQRKQTKFNELPSPTLPIKSSKADSQSGSEEWKWGRAMNNDWVSAFLAFLMMSSVPFIVLLMLHSCRFHQCAISGSLYEAMTDGVSWKWLPPVTTRAWVIYIGWFLFQLALFKWMPGPIDHGQPTNAGYTLAYKVNGWNAWFFSHAVLFVAVYVLGLFPATIIADEWFAMWTVLNTFGYFWTFVAYFKAWFAPTHHDDCKWSGSLLYDLFMGVEHNPRVNDWFDFKLFFNGRPGILGWSVINFSFAAKQYAEHGFVSNSMIVVHLFHLIYILDFFKHEGWYLRTIDIAHDHFGFYLAWGDTVFLPMTYTLQSLYLLYHPVQLSTPALIGVLALGFSGYGIFRAVNNQKDRVRKTKGKCMIWGKPATYIEVNYMTRDGPRSSLLLTSGFWGLSRHFNYVGDLMLSSAMCLACGVTHLLPYFYITFMTIVLLHRVGRDQARCQAKYGKYWDEYCRLVPYKVLPFIY